MKIRIGKNRGPVSLAKQVEAEGFAFGRRDDGECILSVKFPGVETLEMTQEDIGLIISILDRPAIEGNGPGAVFARTATEDSEGRLTAKFSEATRSRSVSFSREDRSEVADLLRHHLNAWGDYKKRLIQAEWDAAGE